MVKVSYGLLDSLDIYVKFGASGLNIKEESFSGPSIISVVGGGGLFIAPASIITGALKYDIHNAFTYGAGAKLNYHIPENKILGKNWIIGLDIQYLRSEHNYNASVGYVFLFHRRLLVAVGFSKL